MKILIITHHLNFFSGSEIFTATLAEELKKAGHDVFVFSPCLGSVFAGRLRKSGIMATDNLLDFRDVDFDLIHAQHNTTAIIARSVFPEVPMVFMSHGRFPELEQPPSIDLGIAAYLATCEAGKDRLAKKYALDPEKIYIIRNIINTEKFRLEKPLNEKPKKLLVISHHYLNEIKKVIEKACQEMGIATSHIGLPENPVENVADYINDADIVVSIGRGAQEAMACGRNVIVYDMHGADGFVDENNFFEIRKHNFSGRRFGRKYSKDDFEQELAKYDPEIGKKLRTLIVQENSIPVQLPKLLEIYSMAADTGVGNSQIKKNQLYNELVFLENKAKENFFLREEINLTKSSKFWKMKEKYSSIKNIISPKGHKKA